MKDRISLRILNTIKKSFFLNFFLSKNILPYMDFFYLNLLIFFVKSHQILHDCFSSDVNFDYFSNKSIDYIISCPNKKIQKINLNNTTNIKSISIFKDSHVIFECSPLIQNINLLIYNKPKIAFENQCYFYNIEIFDAPEFYWNQNFKVKTKNVVLYNDHYQLPFLSENIIYSQNRKPNYIIDEPNTSLLNNDYERECDEIFRIYFSSDNVTFICSYTYTLEISYKEINSYSFKIIGNDYLNIINSDEKGKFGNYISSIMKNIELPDNYNILFSDFLYVEDVENYLNVFDKYPGRKIWLTLTWENYLEDGRYYRYCPWEDSSLSFLPEYQDLEYYYDRLESGTRWRKACVGKTGILFEQDETHGELIVFSSTSTLTIIIVVIVVVLAVLIANAVIAYQVYKKHYKKETKESED